MDLTTLLRILLRRWLVVVPLLLLTVGSAYQVGKSIDPVYEGKASVLFLPSSERQGSEQNPYQEISRAIETTAQAVALIVSDADTARGILQNRSESYTVSVEAETPILHIRAVSDDPARTLVILNAVVEAIDQELADRQSSIGAPADQFLQAELLTEASNARAIYGSRDRAVAATLVLGLGAVVTAALLTEAWVTRRRARKAERAEKTESAEALRALDEEREVGTVEALRKNGRGADVTSGQRAASNT